MTGRRKNRQLKRKLRTAPHSAKKTSKSKRSAKLRARKSLRTEATSPHSAAQRKRKMHGKNQHSGKSLRFRKRSSLRRKRLHPDRRRRTAAAPAKTPKLLNKGINLIGFIRAEMGLGEACRGTAKSLELGGIPFGIADFSDHCPASKNDLTWMHKVTPKLSHLVNLLYFNPDSMQGALDQYGPRRFRNRYNIGYWHWELPDFPEAYCQGFLQVQEVWVPTLFNLDTIARKSPVPVVRIPHGIEPVTPDRPVERSQYGLPEQSFLFLCMADSHSYQLRKNPQASIRAFQEAFTETDESAALVVKLHHAAAAELAELQQLTSGWNNIYIIQHTLSRMDLNRLIFACDSYISLHHAEGFGLGLAESMYFGKPVIGTNWSGNTDFMNSRNSCPVDFELTPIGQSWGPYEANQLWAEPDISHAAYYMKRLVQEEAWRSEIAARGQHTIRTEYSPQAAAQHITARLQRLGLL